MSGYPLESASQSTSSSLAARHPRNPPHNNHIYSVDFPRDSNQPPINQADLQVSLDWSSLDEASDVDDIMRRGPGPLFLSRHVDGERELRP